MNANFAGTMRAWTWGLAVKLNLRQIGIVRTLPGRKNDICGNRYLPQNWMPSRTSISSDANDLTKWMGCFKWPESINIATDQNNRIDWAANKIDRKRERKHIEIRAIQIFINSGIEWNWFECAAVHNFYFYYFNKQTNVIHRDLDHFVCVRRPQDTVFGELVTFTTTGYGGADVIQELIPGNR